MAFTYVLNTNASADITQYFNFKEQLKANGGGTFVQSGDGTGGNYSTGDILTAVGTGEPSANNITNRSAWWHYRWPNGIEIIWQRTTVGNDIDQITIWYSPAAGFINGTATATTRQTASDEQVLNATKPGTTGTDWCRGLPGVASASNSIMNCAFGGAPENYAFYSFVHLRGQRQPNGGMFVDALEDSPSYVEHPYVVSTLHDRDLFTYEGGYMDGTILNAGNSNHKCAAYPGPLPTTTNSILPFMQSAYVLHPGHIASPGDEWGAEAAMNGLNQLVSPWHGGYDSWGMAMWFTAGRLDSTNYSGRNAFLGRSRLFKPTNLADRARDISSDLLWRFTEQMAYRWDGSTNLMI